MHIRINADNIVTEVHIEKIEEPFLGGKVVKRANSFVGKRFEDFLKFALTERFFLKVPVLNVYGKKVITLWAIAARESKGIENMKKIISSFKVRNFAYAEIHLCAKDSTLVLMESALSETYKSFGFTKEIIKLDMLSKDIKEIAKDFNIARNSYNGIYILAPKGGYIIMGLKGTMFICSGPEGDIIMNKKEILSLSKDTLLKFASITYTNPSTEEEKKEINEVTQFIKNKLKQK